MDPKAWLREYGEIQEQHIRRQIGKLRRAAVHRSGYFYKMVKRWRTGLIAQDTPIGGTQYVLNHFAGDPTYDEDACRQLIRKHVRHCTWNTTTPTYEEYSRCLRAPKNKSAGPDGVPPLLDVAKAFPSVPRPMLTGIVKEAGAPENIIRMLGEIYHHTPAVLTLHGKDLPIRPTGGMKEGCPLSPTLFYYTTTCYYAKP